MNIRCGVNIVRRRLGPLIQIILSNLFIPAVAGCAAGGVVFAGGGGWGEFGGVVVAGVDVVVAQVVGLSVVVGFLMGEEA